MTAEDRGLRQLGPAELLSLVVVVGLIVPGVARGCAGAWTEHGAEGLRAQVLAPALASAVPRLHCRAEGAAASPTAWRAACADAR